MTATKKPLLKVTLLSIKAAAVASKVVVLIAVIIKTQKMGQ